MKQQAAEQQAARDAEHARQLAQAQRQLAALQMTAAGASRDDPAQARPSFSARELFAQGAQAAPRA